jgi:hypothetical protein
MVTGVFLGSFPADLGKLTLLSPIAGTVSEMKEGATEGKISKHMLARCRGVPTDRRGHRLDSVGRGFGSKMRAYDSWKLVQIQRGRATVTGFNMDRKSDLGVVFLFSDFGARIPREISA